MTNSHSRMRSQRQLPVFRKYHELFPDGSGTAPQSKALSASKLSPTFSGALEWIKRNCEIVNTALRLLQIYPNLIQDESLDTVWEFLQPFMEGSYEPDPFPMEEREKDCDDGAQTGSQTGMEKGISINASNRTHSCRSCGSCGESYSRTNLFVCGSISDGNVNITGTNTERIVAALSPYCYVRSNPPQVQGPFSEICRNVTSADAFIFVMNDKTLLNDVCMHHLGVAVAFHVPIVVVREAGFKLPKQLPDHFQRTEIVRRYQLKSSRKTSPCEPGHFTDSGEGSPIEDIVDVDVDTSPQQTLLLSEVIRDCYENSLVYVPTFHDSCIGKLFGKLSDYLGDSFLDFEITRSHQPVSAQASSGPQVMSNMNPSVFRNLYSEPASPAVNSEREGSSGEETGSNITGMSRPVMKRVDNDNNSLKLPPISHQSNQNLVTADSELSSPPSSQHVSDSAHRTTLVPALDPNDNPSPSPVPLETNYLICPNRSYGNMSKDPFVVSFPAQLDLLDNKVTDYLTSVSPTLTYVKLDFEYRSVASSPSIRTPRATPTPREASERRNQTKKPAATYNKAPSKATSPSQSHSRRQTPMGNLKRENSDFRARKVNRVRLAKPKSRSKDSMEISRVTLQYNVPPIRQNSLR